MDDMMLYCFMGLLVMFILYTILRNQARVNPDNRDYRVYGDERPRHDDPTIRGRGSFGRDSNESSGWDDFRRRESGTPSSAPRPSNDSPRVRGRGSFGRDKS